MVQLYRSVRLIKGPCRSPQVADLLPVMPDAVVRGHISFHLDPQPVLRKLPLIVDQMETPGVDLYPIHCMQHPKGRRRKIPVQRHLGGPVLKNPVLTVLQPRQPIGQDRDPIFLSLYLIFPARLGTCPDLVNVFHDTFSYLLILLFPCVPFPGR